MPQWPTVTLAVNEEMFNWLARRAKTSGLTIMEVIRELINAEIEQEAADLRDGA